MRNYKIDIVGIVCLSGLLSVAWVHRDITTVPELQVGVHASSFTIAEDMSGAHCDSTVNVPISHYDNRDIAKCRYHYTKSDLLDLKNCASSPESLNIRYDPTEETNREFCRMISHKCVFDQSNVHCVTHNPTHVDLYLVSRTRGSRGGSRRHLYMKSNKNYYYFKNNVIRQSGVNHGNLITIPLTDNLTNLTSVHKPICAGVFNARSVCNKATEVCELIIDKGLDVLFLTETWLRDDNSNGTVLHDLVPQGYEIFHQPRVGIRGGGTAIIYRKHLNVTLAKPHNISITKFELLECSLNFGSVTTHIICVYHPPENSISTFIHELEDLLSLRSTTTTSILLVGDLNIHVDDTSKLATKQLLTVFETFSLNQLVNSATHTGNHTLDIVACTNSIVPDDSVNVTESGTTSDHFLVNFSIDQESHSSDSILPKRKLRKLKSVNINEFQSDISASAESLEITCPHQATEDLNTSLLKVLDSHAPLVDFQPRQRPTAPWMNSAILDGRRHRRHLEKTYKRTLKQSDKDAYIEQLKKVNSDIKNAKREYYTNKIQNAQSNQRELFSVFRHLIQQEDKVKFPELPVYTLPETFAAYFSDKIEKIRLDLDAKNDASVIGNCTVKEPNISNLDTFAPTSETELQSVCKNIAIKTCLLDPIPKVLLKDSLPCLTPCWVKLFNKSFELGIFPNSMKHAVISPLIKKSTLDQNNLKNYRPVSNLPFDAKLMERIVALRLHEHFSINNLYTVNQSAYRSGHSVESALLSITDSVLRSLDLNHGVIVVLLDLSAAFDTIDHQILVERLKTQFHITGKALEWISSYLHCRTYSVKVGSETSKPRTLHYGVPQGSVLGPFLYTAYTAPLADLLKLHGVSFHFYADDTQLWVPVDLDDENDIKAAISTLEHCILHVKLWMSQNKLKLNSDKTEVLVMHPKLRTRNTPVVTLNLGDASISSNPAARNLGVKFDTTLSFHDQITSVCRSSYMHLRNIGAVTKYLPRDVLLGLVHAFVTSRIDFCNSLYAGLPDYEIARLQKVQNQAARVITGTSRFSHITPVLADLHWLPVSRRIQFKLLLFIHRFVYGNSPNYLDLKLSKPVRFTKRSLAPTLELPIAKHVNAGDRAFSIAGPSAWNRLPQNLRMIEDFKIFKSYLKTHLYTLAFH